jgi:anti-anti-sigma factor
MMNRFSTEPATHPSMHIITLGACFDAQAEHALESAVYQAQEAQGRHILLNLQAVTMIDSRGLGKLFLTYHHLNRQKIGLSIVSPRPIVREMLEFVNFPKLVPIYDSMEDVPMHEPAMMKSTQFHSGVV